MTTTQKLTRLAANLDLTVSSNESGMVARDAAGDVKFGATIVNGKFHGGYTVDSLGHVMSHDTVRDLCRLAG